MYNFAALRLFSNKDFHTEIFTRIVEIKKNHAIYNSIDFINTKNRNSHQFFFFNRIAKNYYNFRVNFNGFK